MASYTLLSSPDVKCQDRFSLLDTDEPEVPFWELLEVVLAESVSSSRQITETLDTIAVMLRGSSISDYGRLRDALDSTPDIVRIWPKMVEVALSMPRLFPSHDLPIVSRDKPVLSLSRLQACCLVIHQFLCTLQPPSWQDGYQDFDLWYTSHQPHDTAADVYLTSLLTYFSRCFGSETFLNEPDWSINYTLHSADQLAPGKATLLPLEVVRVDHVSTCEDLIGLGQRACVVSANKFVGFGQSATQEEIFVGTCPEACPIVLVTSPLQDDHVLTVRGAEAMVETVGQRRNFSLVGPYKHDPCHRDKWRTRSMLFMDALELDLAADGDQLPDLLPANLQRERQKAQTAFASASYESVSVGFWGCGAFNGDAHVKMLLLWCAASAAGTTLRVVCESGQHEFGEQLERVAGEARRELGTIEALETLLYSADAGRLGKGEMLDFIQARLARL